MSQAVAQFKINKYTISTGGGVIANQNYQITGTVGQSEASITSSGENYKLNSGFWTPGADNDLIYKNGFE